MEELRLALQRAEQSPNDVKILPIFLDVSMKEYSNDSRNFLDIWDGRGQSNSTLQGWKDALEKVLRYTGVRLDQVICSSGQWHRQTSSCRFLRHCLCTHQHSIERGAAAQCCFISSGGIAGAAMS